MDISFQKLILGRELRTCDRCGVPTFWFRSRQPKKGCCISHANDDGPSYPEAIITALSIFPGSQVTRPRVDWQEPGTYATWVPVEVAWRTYPGHRSVAPYVRRVRSWALPLDAGPCRGCGFRDPGLRTRRSPVLRGVRPGAGVDQ
jgi:hypothetical protein